MKYFIATYGCQANYADSERIARKLKNMGHQKAASEKEADLIVINACSVRQSAMDRVYTKINKYRNKKIILAGCVLPSDKNKLKSKVSKIWHPDEYFGCSPIYSDKSSAYIPIMTGCDNFCSYCAVPFTRGREKSRPAAEIINEIKNLIKNGYKEIWLLGQNVNSYREKLNFPLLLKIINNIPGDFKIHFLTSHPKDMSDELIKTIAECEKVSKEIHLPMQSGDNTVLKKMNRKYTIGHYKNLVKKIRKSIPDAKISTDIIVGFPGETKKQFENTVKLAREIGFKKAYIAKYSPRVGTAAFKLKDNVPLGEKKRRWQILDRLINKK
jgi:tRNA-2-methylthio-N6-dimethylallyladenosine synthase